MTPTRELLIAETILNWANAINLILALVGTVASVFILHYSNKIDKAVGRHKNLHRYKKKYWERLNIAIAFSISLITIIAFFLGRYVSGEKDRIAKIIQDNSAQKIAESNAIAHKADSATVAANLKIEILKVENQRLKYYTDELGILNRSKNLVSLYRLIKSTSSPDIKRQAQARFDVMYKQEWSPERKQALSILLENSVASEKTRLEFVKDYFNSYQLNSAKYTEKVDKVYSNVMYPNQLDDQQHNIDTFNGFTMMIILTGENIPMFNFEEFERACKLQKNGKVNHTNLK